MSSPTEIPNDPIAQMMGAKPPETVEEMRGMLDGFAGMMNAELPEVGACHDDVPVEGSPGVTADVVVPKGDGPFPVLVYLHGGGWICGSTKTHRKLAFRFAEAGYLVLNIEYRLAPEAPFPAPFDDCVAAIRWAAREAKRWGGDPTRLAVGGDSAGGNLSAACAIALADDPEVKISAAVLIYGVFDFASMGQGTAPAAGPMSAEDGEKIVELMIGSYLGKDRTDAQLEDPRVSPIHGAEKLPPTHIVCGGADSLAAQSEALAKRLEAAGIVHEKFIDENMPHGYAQMEMFPQARQAIDRMVAFLDTQLAS